MISASATLEEQFGQFTTRDGNPIHPSEVIFPIWKVLGPSEYRMVGTGFFITMAGHFLTAAHVMKEFIDESGNPTNQGFIVPPVDLKKGLIFRRKILKCTFTRYADIAVCETEIPIHPQTGLPVTNRVPVLTTESPRPGDEIRTCFYDEKSQHSSGQFLAHVEILTGTFRQPRPGGRDSVMCPWPGFIANLPIPLGSSGGPVLDQHSRVFAINCTGFDGTDISYLSRIEEALKLTVSNIVLAGKTEPQCMDILELARRQVILFDPPINE